ncbi:uncharacterized protein V6R79_012366 [Siganus canaliculatus]
MPIDMSVPLYLPKDDFFRSPPAFKPSSCLRFQRQVGSTDEVRPSQRDSRKTRKKQVTFADHQGLSLTRVKVFSPFSDPIDVPLNVQEALSSALRLSAPDDKLVLDFAQPSSDYLRFRQSLDQNLVSLEHCVLQERALAGTVKVKNVSFQKSVRLRVTFDSWKSHVDVDCVYVKDTYPGSCWDTFSFQVDLPELPPHERLEFAVCYEVDGRQHWDSNQGHNYRVVWSSLRRGRQEAPRGPDPCFHLDRFGSPTCSHGLLPDWPSYAGYEYVGPYY